MSCGEISKLLVQQLFDQVLVQFLARESEMFNFTVTRCSCWTSNNPLTLLAVHMAHVSAVIFSCPSHIRLMKQILFSLNPCSCLHWLHNSSYNLKLLVRLFFSTCNYTDCKQCQNTSEYTAALWLSRSGADTDTGRQLLLLCCLRCAAGEDKVLVTVFP